MALASAFMAASMSLASQAGKQVRLQLFFRLVSSGIEW